MKNKVVGLTPDVSGVGGMVSFRNKLRTGLTALGVRVTNSLEDPDLDALLVIGGTRNLAGLQRLRRRGVRIVQRLDGINWMHRRRKTGFKHYLRSETANWLLKTIRNRFVDGIVYQSAFSKSWWEQVYGKAPSPDRIILNAVNLEVYTPRGMHQRPAGHLRILLVEGSLQGGYETGLETAVELCRKLSGEHSLDVRLAVAGQVPAALKTRFDQRLPGIDWLGMVPAEWIPETDRSAHLLFSGDINPACPNAVIEALACGLPVAAFDTGALVELVGSSAGVIAPYGGDPWLLGPPDVDGLARAVQPVLRDQEHFRAAARKRAEEYFGLDLMVERYLETLSG